MAVIAEVLWVQDGDAFSSEYEAKDENELMAAVMDEIRTAEACGETFTCMVVIEV